MPLPQPHPDLSALDLLVSVSEHGSISAAARVHHITQPAASMRLRSLEEALQVQLLERSRTGTRLTPAGVATVEWAGAVLREVRTLLAGTAALRADRDCQLNVAASLTVAEYMVPRWLERFTMRAPDTKVSLEMGNTAHVLDLVADGAVELGFIEGPAPPDGMRWRQVGIDELVIVVGAAHPWRRRREPLSPEEMAQTPFILRESGSGTREVLVEALAQHGLAPRPAMELGSTTAIKAAVMAGSAPAAVSALAVANELESGQLVLVPYAGIELGRTIRAVWSAGRRLSPLARQLMAIASDGRDG